MVGRKKEKMIRLLKDYRIILWLAFVIVSLILLFPYKSGVVVKSVSEDSPLKGKVFPGDVITWVNEKRIKSAEDLYAFNNFTGILRLQVNGKLVLAEVNKNLGISVEQAKGNLKFGLDIGGGVRVLLEPEENASTEIIEAAKEKIEARINIFGLKEARLTLIDVGKKKYIQIEMAGGEIGDVKEVLERQGKLEAKIPKKVEIENKKGYLLLGGKRLKVEIINESAVAVNGSIYAINQTFYLENIEFEIGNITSNSVTFFAKVFDSQDVKRVCMVEQPGVCRVFLFYNPKTGLYEFSFGISISKEAAERMKKLTQDMKIVYSPSGERVLKDGVLMLYLDGKLKDVLTISPELKGKLVTEAAITGAEKSKEEAKKEMRILQTILSSGTLPVKLKIVKIEEISPLFGAEFLKEVIIIAFIAEAVVVSIVFLRYRNFKISIPMIAVSASEVLIILGIASLINWTIDLPALAGIIAVLGTGVDAQIMIIDEALSERKRIYSLKEKIKRAFFIIFSSAATTFVAMLPLLSVGAKVMQGFAVTTIIGLLVAVFITRPAFGKMVEEML